LFRCGLLTQEQLAASLRKLDGSFEPEQIAEMVRADAWMVREDFDEIETVQ
jgi:hypothetical protein